MPYISSGHGQADPKAIMALYIVLCIITLPSFIYSLYKWKKDKEFLGMDVSMHHFVLSITFLMVNLIACIVWLTFIVKSFL